MFGTTSKTAPVAPDFNGIHQSTVGGPANRLSSDVFIKGELSFSTELVIDGKVEGNITSSGKLIVGLHGQVVGDIHAGSVTVQGSVTGDILATDRCALEAGGRLQGDVESPRLAVDENASFIGSATISAKRS